MGCLIIGTDMDLQTNKEQGHMCVIAPTVIEPDTKYTFCCTYPDAANGQRLKWHKKSWTPRQLWAMYLQYKNDIDETTGISKRTFPETRGDLVFLADDLQFQIGDIVPFNPYIYS